MRKNIPTNVYIAPMIKTFQVFAGTYAIMPQMQTKKLSLRKITKKINAVAHLLGLLGGVGPPQKTSRITN